MASAAPVRPPSKRKSSTKTTKSSSSTKKSTLPDVASAEKVDIWDLPVASLSKLPLLQFAEASGIRGTAEYLATRLNGRGHSCPHFPKYRVEDHKSPYPSRLGFFHRTDSNFSYLDTSKLCANCCSDVIPDGYNAWSTFKKATKAGGTKDTKKEQPPGGLPSRGWLDITSSAEFYPRAFQAGTENFTDGPEFKRSKLAKDTPTVIAKVIAADSVTIPLPLDRETKVAWQWLEVQGKPFYIDQLHLTRKWSPLAEKNAAMDANISANSGTAFDAATLATQKEPASPTRAKKRATTDSTKPALIDSVSRPAEMEAGNQQPGIVSRLNLSFPQQEIRCNIGEF